jgi:diadenosine tetraphosphatase ApaH/serine/threonine PP2A family protein phosphatase
MTVYAPGALFTYEGGLGCCVAVPQYTPFTPKSPAISQQLFEILEEYVSSWLSRALACRETPTVLPEQCLDEAFMNHQNQPKVDQARFALNEPSRIGFKPDPLVFSCSDCGLIAEFSDIVDLNKRWIHEDSRTDCPNSAVGRHHFRQLDVVFAHWSGNYTGLSPSRFIVNPHGRVDLLRKCKNCDGQEYRLLRNSSPFFSDWAFQCTQCLTKTEIVRADRETQELLLADPGQNGRSLPREYNMLPVSYRASSVFNVQRETFILFKSADATGVLTASRRADLVSQLMKSFDFPGVPLSHDEVERQLRTNGRTAEADNYREIIDNMLAAPKSLQKILDDLLSDKLASYQSAGFVTLQRDESPGLVSQVEASKDWARRYNPIRLAVEHRSLYEETIAREGTDLALPAISVANPEICYIDDPSTKIQYSAHVKESFAKLGVEEMLLLRGLDLCEFSFGYTRVSATPTTTQKDLAMPVRLKAFDYVDRGKRPIYVLEQKNEAFYIRLDETRVAEWLRDNGLGESPSAGITARLGGRYILEYQDFGMFLEDYKERSSEASTPRSVPSYIYLLLHTFAHHFAQSLVEYSGLEHGSIGEYIFPADLAILVYRRGMTPDLGNLSAMWRNFGRTILDDLLSDRRLKCDSGSLCDHRGAACPACIMAPEVACLAGNHLLCRSTLRGGMPPGWDLVKTPLLPYFRGKLA